MAYSTQTQLENNVKILEKTFTDATQRQELAEERIALADNIVKTDIGNIIDVSLIPAVDASPATPVYVNLLSQYKSAEFTLRRLIGVKRRSTELDDISEWERLYNDLLERIQNGQVELELSDGTGIGTGITTVSQDAFENVNPDFGFDEYGKYSDAERLEDIRDDEIEGY